MKYKQKRINQLVTTLHHQMHLSKTQKNGAPMTLMGVIQLLHYHTKADDGANYIMKEALNRLYPDDMEEAPQKPVTPVQMPLDFGVNK